MVSKNQLRQIVRLREKKYQQQEGLFVAEGVKVIGEFLQASYELHQLFTTQADLFPENPPRMQLVTEAELQKMSNRVTPHGALAVFAIPAPPQLKIVYSQPLVLALDYVNDPGNLGTIIRLCDWFGVRYLVCSRETVDCYNPKVVQASMGSLARVGIAYADLPDFLEKASLPVLVADTAGENLYTTALPERAIVVMGNEASGVSEAVVRMAQRRISIPNYSWEQRAESLNVAMAAAIVLSEFRRQATADI